MNKKGEVCALTWDDIDLENRIIQIRHNVYDKPNEDKLKLVFTKVDGTYIGTDLTGYPFKIIHNELGIEKCRFYDLRGSYATKILNSGVEIRDVADLLGHRNIETTENFYISSTTKSKIFANNTFDSIAKSDTINEIIKYDI